MAFRFFASFAFIFLTSILIEPVLGQALPHQASMERKPVPLGSADAKPGGTFRIRSNAEPYSLNPIVSDGFQSVDIQFYVIEGLLQINEDTHAWQPWLADRWRVLDGGRIHEFHLRENARWSDGQPVTSADVKFSFDVIFDSRYPTAHMRPYYENIEKINVIDSHTVQFFVKNSYFGNFYSSAGLPIVPKHIYGDPEKGPAIHKTISGSGPYVFERWLEGRSITLKKNPLWWGWNDPLYKGKFNPERVSFQFVGDDNIAFERLKKGEIDFMSLSADQYVRALKEVNDASTFLVEKYRNLAPQPVSTIGLNYRRPIFRDLRVRQALSHLLDRQTMVEKFFRGFMLPATGPWYRQSEFADPEMQVPRFDPALALHILRLAGWTDSDGDGVLDKVIDGKRVDLRFTVLTSTRQSERWLTLFREDAKRAGVDVLIRVLNSNAFSAVLNDGNFDAADFSQGGWLVEFDPKPGWHSKSVGKSGLNFTAYSDPVADQLIEEARSIPEFDKRKPLMQKLFRRIAEQVPHLFLLNGADSFYAYSKRMARPKPTFNYDVGLKFWWVSR